MFIYFVIALYTSIFSNACVTLKIVNATFTRGDSMPLNGVLTNSSKEPLWIIKSPHDNLCRYGVPSSWVRLKVIESKICGSIGDKLYYLAPGKSIPIAVEIGNQYHLDMPIGDYSIPVVAIVTTSPTPERPTSTLSSWPILVTVTILPARQ